jgi:hypothetical protein
VGDAVGAGEHSRLYEGEAHCNYRQSEWSLYLCLVILSREGCQEVQEVSRFVGLFWLGLEMMMYVPTVSCWLCCPNFAEGVS